MEVYNYMEYVVDTLLPNLLKEYGGIMYLLSVYKRY